MSTYCEALCMPLIQVNEHTFMSQAVSRGSVIIDLGANHGGFCRSMIARFGCRCIAVEANPSLCASIPPDPLLTVVNAAIAAESGMLPFHICGNDEASSLRRREREGIVETVLVPAMTLGELLDRYNLSTVDLLKVDIEGAEIEVLESFPDELVRRIPQITVEFHDFCDLIPRAAAVNIVDRFRRLGFDVLRMWMRSHGDTLFVNRKLAGVGAADLAWSRWVVRNWWGTERFVRRKLGVST
jgi:FkbM family methyltransferase